MWVAECRACKNCNQLMQNSCLLQPHAKATRNRGIQIIFSFSVEVNIQIVYFPIMCQNKFEKSFFWVFEFMTEALCISIKLERQAKYFFRLEIFYKSLWRPQIFSNISVANVFKYFRSRKRRGSETLSEEEERSSGDESGAGGRPRRGRRSGQRLRKERVGRGEEMMVPGDMTRKMLTGVRRSGSPVIMTECTAAMVLMDLSCSPANRGRMSHASGHSGRRIFFKTILIFVILFKLTNV